MYKEIYNRFFGKLSAERKLDGHFMVLWDNLHVVDEDDIQSIMDDVVEVKLTEGYPEKTYSKASTLEDMLLRELGRRQYNANRPSPKPGRVDELSVKIVD